MLLAEAPPGSIEAILHSIDVLNLDNLKKKYIFFFFFTIY